MKGDKARVKVYYGYGHKNDLVLYGHVLEGAERIQKKFTITRRYAKIIGQLILCARCVC